MIIRVTNWEGIAAGTLLQVKGVRGTYRFVAFCMSGNKAWVEAVGGKKGEHGLFHFPPEWVSVARVDTRSGRRFWRRKKENDGD